MDTLKEQEDRVRLERIAKRLFYDIKRAHMLKFGEELSEDVVKRALVELRKKRQEKFLQEELSFFSDEDLILIAENTYPGIFD